MSVAQAELKQLWGRAASTCSICRRLLDGITAEGKAAPAGEAAHIVAKRKTGPRGESILAPSERNSYLNLILLCPTCHTLVDKDPTGYPVEKLHMLKAHHELRVRGDLGQFALSDDESNPLSEPDLESIVAFVKAWADFLPFYSLLFNLIQMKQMEESKRNFLKEGPLKELGEWHRRRDALKELLFNASEDALVVQRVPAWERLTNSSTYIREGNYITPFSFILDFVNPYGMVLHHGDDLWAASFISHEFADFLSFKYEKVKSVWRTNA